MSTKKVISVLLLSCIFAFPTWAQVQVTPGFSPMDIVIGPPDVPRPSLEWASVQLLPKLLPARGSSESQRHRALDQNGFYITSELETSLSSKVLATHYKTQLAKEGWLLTSSGQSKPLTWNTWNIVDKSGQAWEGLFLITQSLSQEGHYFIYMQVDKVPLVAQQLTPDRPMPVSIVLPLLVNPANVQPSTYYLSPEMLSGKRIVYTGTKLETDMDGKALATHYNNQLTKAGWLLTSSKQNGPFVKNVWSFRDKTGQTWKGVSFVLEMSAEDSRFVFFEAERAL